MFEKMGKVLDKFWNAVSECGLNLTEHQDEKTQDAEDNDPVCGTEEKVYYRTDDVPEVCG